jgi:hypothetical protein
MGEHTPNLDLYKPDEGEAGSSWGPELRTNFDKIDAFAGSSGSSGFGSSGSSGTSGSSGSSGFTAITAGSYIGDGTTINRAIPHGLGGTPKQIFISEGSAGLLFSINGNLGWINYINSSQLPVTVPDAANFYVGNSTDYNFSANVLGVAYYWVAFK